jgi:hypothetical protein
MSTSGIKLLCGTPFARRNDQTGILVLLVPYDFEPVVLGHDRGGVEIPIEERTETELNAIIQQSVAQHANNDFPGNYFAESDVIGGRI